MLAAIAHLVSASHLECHFGNLKDGNLNAWNTMIVKTVGMLSPVMRRLWIIKIFKI